MGMPKIELEILDRGDVFNNIIGSIALQEAALSHLLNAGGEKLQTAVKLADPTKTANNPISIDDLLNVNEVIGAFVSRLTDFEKSLQSKLAGILDYVKADEKLQPSVEFAFYNYEKVNGANTTNPVAGAVWSATGRQPLPNGEYVNVYQTAASDTKGAVLFSLPPGDYILRQISVPDGYKLPDEDLNLAVGSSAQGTTIDGEPALTNPQYNVVV
jgi:hypothetical protein